MSTYRKQKGWLGSIEADGTQVLFTYAAGATGMRLEPADARRLAKWLRRAADAAEGKPLEAEQAEAVPWEPKRGDRVDVLYGKNRGPASTIWIGPGTVTGVARQGWALVELDNGERGGFLPAELRLIQAAS